MGAFTGGGIVGSSTAYFLTRHPSYDPALHKITLIEAADVASGASGKAGGLLALWAYPSCIVPLSYQLHADLARRHGGHARWGYRTVSCGRLVAEGKMLPPRDADGRLIGSVDDHRGGGGNHSNGNASDGSTGSSVSNHHRQQQAAAAAAHRKPSAPPDLDWIDVEGVRLYETMDEPGATAQVHPYHFTNSIAALACEQGVELVHGLVSSIDLAPTPATGDGARVVAYTDKATGEARTLAASDVIVAAGPWTKRLFPAAPISVMRAHSVIIHPARPVSAHALFTDLTLPPGFFRHRDAAAAPAAKAAGGANKRARRIDVHPEIYTRPDDTVYACGEGDTLEPLPRTAADVAVDPVKCAELIDSLAAVSRVLRDGKVLARQACYLPNVESARGGPLVGPSGIRGVYLASGHTCWGIQNGPATGKVMSEFIFDGEARSANVGSLDPRKFL